MNIRTGAYGLSTVLLLFFSCREPVPQVGRVIVIQPFEGFLPSQSASVYKELKRINPNTILRSVVPLPALAYYASRNRYRADSLIRYLSQFGSADTILIGLTNKDISTTKDQVKDWGIMGLGYCPGSACIVSTFRLSKADQSNQFYKVAVHELGHTQGLPHCNAKTCFMRDAEGGNPLNEEKGFCSSCKKFLKSKGWKLK